MAVTQAGTVPAGLALTPEQWAIVQHALSSHLSAGEIWAFGSRVSGRAKPFSDLDLAIIGVEGTGPVPAAALANVADELRESDLPFKVDLVDWATVSEAFRSIIREQYVVVSTFGTGLSR